MGGSPSSHSETMRTPGSILIRSVKLRLHKMIHTREEFTEEDYKKVKSTAPFKTILLDGR